MNTYEEMNVVFTKSEIKAAYEFMHGLVKPVTHENSWEEKEFEDHQTFGNPVDAVDAAIEYIWEVEYEKYSVYYGDEGEIYIYLQFDKGCDEKEGFEKYASVTITEYGGFGQFSVNVWTHYWEQYTDDELELKFYPSVRTEFAKILGEEKVTDLVHRTFDLIAQDVYDNMYTS